MSCRDSEVVGATEGFLYKTVMVKLYGLTVSKLNPYKLLGTGVMTLMPKGSHSLHHYSHRETKANGNIMVLGKGMAALGQR